MSDWREKAVCAGADPRLFDPAHHNESEHDLAVRISQARAYCNRCPVQVKCLADAKAVKDEGVRGGQLLGNRRMQNGCGTVPAYLRHHKLGEPKCEPCITAYAAKRYAERERSILKRRSA